MIEGFKFTGWLREPLLHFMLLAGLLFLLDHWTTGKQKEEIVVSQQVIDFLVQQREDLELRELSFEERQETVEQFIEDEILYTEAYKRGLDRGDSRMRRNLVLKMRGLLAGEIREPSEEQLRAWYEENPERFTVPETWGFQQVFFSDPNAVPEGLLERLNDGLDSTSVGEDRMSIPRNLAEANQRRLVSILGPKNTKTLLVTRTGQWIGALESPFGVHFARTVSYRPAFQQPYETVQRYLSGEWMLEQRRLRVEREIAGLRDDYNINVSGTMQ